MNKALNQPPFRGHQDFGRVAAFASSPLPIATGKVFPMKFHASIAGRGLAITATMGLAAVVAAMPFPSKPECGVEPQSKYVAQVLSLNPAGYWRLNEEAGPVAQDASPHKRSGTYHGSPTYRETGPVNGGHGVGFNGRDAYVEVASHKDFSIGSHGLTVEVWMRPDKLEFPGETTDPYVLWLGKGEVNQEEWGFRFYTRKSSRPNRISAYAWNLAGGEGAGAYFQTSPAPGKWMHVVACYEPGGPTNPAAGVTIYLNGVKQLGPPEPGAVYANPAFHVVPQPGKAPVRFATRDQKSFLTGGLSEVAIYARVLSDKEIRANFLAAP